MCPSSSNNNNKDQHDDDPPPSPRRRPINNHHSHSHRTLLAEAATTTVDDHVILDMNEHLPQSARRLVVDAAAVDEEPLFLRQVVQIVTGTGTTDTTATTTTTSTQPPPSSPLYPEDDIETTIAAVAASPNDDHIDDNDKANHRHHHHGCGGRVLEYIQYTYSTLLLLFSLVVVLYAMVTTTNSSNSSSTTTILSIVAVVLVFGTALASLAILEGTQGAVVGLQSVSTQHYATTHPRTYQNTRLIHPPPPHDNDDNDDDDDDDTKSNKNDDGNSTDNNRLERFIIGRQFLVVLVVFILNTLSSSPPGTTLFGGATDNNPPVLLLDILTTIFLTNGVAAILITIVLGQLMSQIVSANCMLDFMNQRVVVRLVTQASLLVESSGLCHAVYLFQRACGKLQQQQNPLSTPTSTNDDRQREVASVVSSQTSVRFSQKSRTLWKDGFFWIRVLLSVSVLIFSFAVTITALVQNQTKMWDGVPVAVSILLFVGLMMVVGMLEGLQIALFAVIRRSDLQTNHPMAYQNSQLILSRAHNLPAFLIGRQMLVTGCTFIVARITAINVNVDDDEDDNVWGVSDSVQYFFNTGLLGAVITTIMASLIWRVIAASYPVAFLSNPLVSILIRSCLYLEMSGVCSSAWLLAYVYKKLMNFQSDDTYLGHNNNNNNNNNNAVEPNDTNNNNDLDLEENATPTHHQ